MPIESTQHIYNPPGPQGWEEMRPYGNENLSPSPLTTYSADRLTAIGLVWITQPILLLLGYPLPPPSAVVIYGSSQSGGTEDRCKGASDATRAHTCNYFYSSELG